MELRGYNRGEAGLRADTLFIIARAVARRGAESRVRREIEALVAPTRAEPGCLRYELFVGRDNPGDFLFVQEYRDEAAFESHLRRGTSPGC